MPSDRITVEGVAELRTAFRQQGGPELVRELGQAHKSVGELVIRKAGGAQTGVGTGAGSTIRPSANTREVQLRVGGRHRADLGKWRQWGVQQVWPPPGSRPYLIGAAVAAESEIVAAYVAAVNRVSPDIRVEV